MIDYQTGGPIGYPRAFGRYIGSIISAIVIYIGYLWMLWTAKSRPGTTRSPAVVVPAQAYAPVGSSQPGARVSTY